MLHNSACAIDSDKNIDHADIQNSLAALDQNNLIKILENYDQPCDLAEVIDLVTNETLQIDNNIRYAAYLHLGSVSPFSCTRFIRYITTVRFFYGF